MIAAISPAASNVEETISTLRFATSVKKIKTHAVQNKEAPGAVVKDLQAEVELLRQQLNEARTLPIGGTAETQDRLHEAESLIQSMKVTWQEEIQKSQAAKEARNNALEDLGLTTEEISDAFGVKGTWPYLLNISDDPLLSGSLMYFLKPNVATRIGSNPQNEIVLKGLAVKNIACIIKYTVVQNGTSDRFDSPERETSGSAALSSEQLLNIEVPDPTARVLLNGKMLNTAHSNDTETDESINNSRGGSSMTYSLHHHDRLIIGRAFAFR